MLRLSKLRSYNAGIFETQDGGLSWTLINHGIEGLPVNSVAVASREPLTIFAGRNVGIWKMTRTDIQDFSVTINQGAIFTNQIGVTLTLTAPSDATQMMISDDGGFGGIAWESFANTKSWNITSYGAYAIPRTVYAKFKTNGQVSAVYQDDIVLDQTHPTGTIQVTDSVTSAVEILPTVPVNFPGMVSATITSIVYLSLVSRDVSNLVFGG